MKSVDGLMLNRLAWIFEIDMPLIPSSRPLLQVALDFTDANEALRMAELVVDGGADIIEAGTPLIKSEGMRVVRLLRERFPHITVVADLKSIDASKVEVEVAARNGADVVTVLGLADDSTIRAAVEEAEKHGVQVCVDMIGVSDPVIRSIEVERMGAKAVCLHVGIDVQRARGLTAASLVREIRTLSRSISIPICVAGGITAETASTLVRAGAHVIIVGSAITRSPDPKGATMELKRIIRL